jgi:hypothetical protein
MMLADNMNETNKHAALGPTSVHLRTRASWSPVRSGNRGPGIRVSLGATWRPVQNFFRRSAARSSGSLGRSVFQGIPQTVGEQTWNLGAFFPLEHWNTLGTPEWPSVFQAGTPLFIWLKLLSGTLEHDISSIGEDSYFILVTTIILHMPPFSP